MRDVCAPAEIMGGLVLSVLSVIHQYRGDCISEPVGILWLCMTSNPEYALQTVLTPQTAYRGWRDWLLTTGGVRCSQVAIQFIGWQMFYFNAFAGLPVSVEKHYHFSEYLNNFKQSSSHLASMAQSRFRFTTLFRFSWWNAQQSRDFALIKISSFSTYCLVCWFRRTEYSISASYNSPIILLNIE